MIYLHGLLDNIPRVDDFPSELNGSVSFREFPSHVWWPRYIMGGFDGSQTTSVSESWQTWIYESYCWLMLYSCILKLLVVDLLKILVINSSTKVTCICFFPEMHSCRLYLFKSWWSFLEVTLPEGPWLGGWCHDRDEDQAQPEDRELMTLSFSNRNQACVFHRALDESPRNIAPPLMRPSVGSVGWFFGIRSNWCFLPKNGRQVNCRWLLSGVLLFAFYDDFFVCGDRCSPASDCSILNWPGWF
jgi:hypothetical protein